MVARNEIIAVELPVTDYLYDETLADTSLRDKFFRFVQPENPPRKGDNLVITAEIWREKLLAFGDIQGLSSQGGSKEENVSRIRDRIFGKPSAIKAGGALANSFDILVKAHVSGAPVTDGYFVTAIGEGLSGEVFSNSLPGKLITPEARGYQLEAHVFPVDGDRIMLSLPSFENPPSNYMSAQQLDAVAINKDTKLVMLGGYMFYTGKYNEFLNALLEKTAAVSPNPAERPTIVLTAAAQEIAASKEISDALKKATETAPVLVFSNAGEFRRMMGLDTEWRKPHEAKWWISKEGQRLVDSQLAVVMNPNTESGIALLKERGWKKLEGDALENAKQADEAYLAGKRAANEVALKAAYERYCRYAPAPVTFVATDGKKGVRVVNNDGVSENFLPPPAPNGVANTVGGGDGFAGGYKLGYIMGLSTKECLELGFICAGEIIGRDEARLFLKETTCTAEGCVISSRGLPAYLDINNPLHKGILFKLGANAPTQPVQKTANRFQFFAKM